MVQRRYDPCMSFVTLLFLFLQLAAGDVPRLQEPYVFVGADDPEEILRVTADHRIEGRLVLLNRAQVLVEGATLTVAGDLLVGESALVRVTAGRLHFEQDWPEQHALYCTNGGRIELVDSEIDTSDRPLRATLFGRSSVTAARSGLGDRIDWTAADEATLRFTSCRDVGAVLQAGDSAVVLDNCTQPLVWLSAPAREAAELRGLQSVETGVWSARSLEFVAGLSADAPRCGLALRECTGVRLGLHVQESAALRLIDCDLAAIRLAFAQESSAAVVLRGLTAVNGQEFVLESGPLRIAAEDSHIARWMVDAGGKSSVRVEDAAHLSAACVTGTADLTLIDCTLDQVGATLRSDDAGTLGAVRCALPAEAAFVGESGVTLHECRFSSLAPVVAETATAALLNCEPARLPAVLDVGLAINLRLSDAQGVAGEPVPIRGRAQLVTWETAVAAPCELAFRPSEAETDWTPVAVGLDSPPEVLALWDTSGVACGAYTLRLTAAQPRGASLAIFARAELSAGTGQAHEARVNDVE